MTGQRTRRFSCLEYLITATEKNPTSFWRWKIRHYVFISDALNEYLKSKVFPPDYINLSKLKIQKYMFKTICMSCRNGTN